MATPVTSKPHELRMFMHAKRFRLTHELLDREPNSEVMNITAIPSLTLSVIASELYLKCLNTIENGKAERTHDLLKLFKALKSATRESLMKKWDAHVPKFEFIFAAAERELGHAVPRDLEACLAAGERAFEDLRYPLPSSKTSVAFGNLPRLLEEVIYETKPGWRTIHYASPKDRA